MPPTVNERLEADRLASLKLALAAATKKLLPANRASLTLRQTDILISDLQTSKDSYKRAVTDLVVAAGDDEEKVAELSDKLLEEIDKVNTPLEDLFTLKENFEAANNPAPQANPVQAKLVSIQLKIKLMRTNLQGRLNLIEDDSKKEAVLSSLPQIQAHLKQLDEQDDFLKQEIEEITDRIAEGGLKGDEVTTVQTEVGDLINQDTARITTLRHRFTGAAAQLEKPEPEAPTRTATSDPSLKEEIAKAFADMRVDLDRRDTAKKVTDFGFAKVQIPHFQGDVKEFTKWKLQVEDYLNEMATKSPKNAVMMLDRLTPKTFDVSRCPDLASAWAKLSSKYGSPAHIARLLLRDFNGVSLTKHTDEAKVIELRDILEKLESDLLTNGQQARCDDFHVLDKAEAMLPGRFRALFVRAKDELVDHHGTGFKALVAFLQEESTMIELHMPDLLDSSSKPESTVKKQESKKIKELEAKLAKYEGKVESEDQRKKPYNKEASEEKMGKCPVCGIFHYYVNSKTKKELASARLSGCPKFKAMSVEERAETIVAKKACAKCLDWRHERPTCTAKIKPCSENGCSANHHQMLHGTKNPKVMALKTSRGASINGVNEEEPEDYGMLAMLHYTFKEVNQGTTVFIDGGSNTSLITTSLANSLYLKGKIRLTTVTRACERTGETEGKIHHTIELKDREGNKHKVKCMEVGFITEPQQQPDYSKVYQMFPHIPHGCLERPDMEVGLLLGQNANALLPTGGEGPDSVGNLRVMRSTIGEYGYVLEGWHPDICTSAKGKPKTMTLQVKINKVVASEESLFPDLADMPMEIPRTCPSCVGCNQCRYEVQDMTFKEKKELDALRQAVTLDPVNKVCRASYPEIDPELPYKDNQWQAIAMSNSMERQLKKSGLLTPYNREFQDLLDRKAVRVVKAHEISEWKERGGKISYISHHPVLTPDKATTKCRIVVNSSLKNAGNGPSPNQNWPKGPNALKPMYQVFVRFRLYDVAIHFDLSKMFHSVQTGEPELFKRLMVWRNGDKNKEWENYGWQVVAFGDRPSSCVLEICKDLTANAGESLDPEAARAIREDTYVDDGATGGDEETAQRLIGETFTAEDGSLAYTGTLSQIFERGGFRVKMIVRSGETNQRALEKMGGTVLGHKWDPTEDTFSFQPKVFLGKKGKNGAYAGPQLLPQNLARSNDFSWTKALVLSTVASIFDPSGIIAAYTVKFKLFLREVCLSKGLGWDESLPWDLMQKWRTLVKELVCSPPITVYRCARPPGAIGKPILVIFSDGSSVAYAAVVYVVHKLLQQTPGPWLAGYDTHATFAARLLISKARVAPLAGMTIPRTEMNGLVLGTKLADLALSSMRETPSSLTFCLDSECTIAAVDSENGLLKPYLANRRAVVKGKVQEWKLKYPETDFEDLQHIAGPLNPADLPTRTNCCAQDVDMNSTWQNGPAFLQLPRNQWPVSRDFRNTIPEDEIIKAMKTPGALLCKIKVNHKDLCTCRVCSLLLDPCQCSLCDQVFKPGETAHHQSLRHILTRTRRIEKSRGIMARVLRASAMLATGRPGGYTAYSKEEMMANIGTPLTVDDYKRTDKVILLLMQPQVKQMLDAKPVGKKKAKNLPKGARTTPTEFLERPIAGTQQTSNLASISPFKEDGVYYTRGRFGKQLKRILGTDKLAILPPTCELAHLLMIKAHSTAHMAGLDTCARSKHEAWIVRARPLADKVAAECLQCRVRLKVPLTQREGFLPEERMLIFTPPFTATAMDFLGPFRVKAMNNARSFLKVWPVVFGCLNTGAVHIELNKTYGTDALLLSITAFTSIRGYPATFYTDRGSQLCKAAQYVDTKEDPKNWGWDVVEDALARKKSQVKFCLPGCQWQNGSAEQRVRGLKDTLELTMTHGSASLDYAEFRTLLVNCADRMNSRPLGALHGETDIQPLTPNHLLIGRTQSGVISKEVLDEGLDKFTKRAKYVAELGKLWWEMWFKQCFPALLPFRGWVERQRNLEEGDIVMVETKHKLGKDSYRLARVTKTHLDEAGLCRRVTLVARPRGGPVGLPYIAKDPEQFDMVTQRLVLIHPHEASMLKKEDLDLSQAQLVT